MTGRHRKFGLYPAFSGHLRHHAQDLSNVNFTLSNVLLVYNQIVHINHKLRKMNGVRRNGKNIYLYTLTRYSFAIDLIWFLYKT